MAWWWCPDIDSSHCIICPAVHVKTVGKLVDKERSRRITESVRTRSKRSGVPRYFGDSQFINTTIEPGERIHISADIHGRVEIWNQRFVLQRGDWSSIHCECPHIAI